jgi:carboxylesterase type B
MCVCVCAISAAQHCDEVALLFLLESFWAPAIAANLTTPDDRLMADQLGELWTNFAKTRYNDKMMYAWQWLL